MKKFFRETGLFFIVMGLEGLGFFVMVPILNDITWLIVSFILAPIFEEMGRRKCVNNNGGKIFTFHTIWVEASGQLLFSIISNMPFILLSALLMSRIIHVMFYFLHKQNIACYKIIFIHATFNIVAMILAIININAIIILHTICSIIAVYYIIKAKRQLAV